MLRFLAGRLMQSALILLGVTIVTFGLTFLIPADPVRMIAGRSASPETVESIRHQLGLDQPIPVQYLRYLGSLLQGDLGRSYVQKAEVTTLVASRLPATLQLMVAAIVFELLLGLPAGIYAATRRNRPSDKALMVLSFTCVSAPQFVVGLLLLASSLDSLPMVGLAILLMGLSFGSEGDVIPYLITRYFDMAIFSTVMGLLSASIGLAMAMGNIILSASLAATDSFDLYLLIAAGGSFFGSGIFLLLGLKRFRAALLLSRHHAPRDDVSARIAD